MGYFADFGENTDVFFCHNKNANRTGFHIQFMDGEWRLCGEIPTYTTCDPVSHFVWHNLWNDEFIAHHRASLRRRPGGAESIFVGATQLKVGCLTRWRWQSTGFGAFLTFGALC